MEQSITALPLPAQAVREVKLDYINALRGLAILAVVLVHTGQYGTDSHYFAGALESFISSGARGVQLFFVASAFTLWLSMSRRKVEKHPTRNFFIRRLFRIAPMYWLGVMYYTWWLTRVGTPPSVSNILANTTFLHGISPHWINSLVPGGWSISVEMFFYCLAPWLFTKLKTVDSTVRFIAIGLLVNCFLPLVLLPAKTGPNYALWQDFLFEYFPSQLPVFGFGILLYQLTASIDRTLRGGTYLLSAAAVLLTLMTELNNGGVHYAFAAGFMLLALGLRSHPTILIVNPIINYIGEVSFSLYLVHFAVLFLLQRSGHAEFLHPTRMTTAILDFAIRYALVVAISTGIATLFYRIIELPFQRFGKRVIAWQQ